MLNVSSPSSICRSTSVSRTLFAIIEAKLPSDLAEKKDSKSGWWFTWEPPFSNQNGLVMPSGPFFGFYESEFSHLVV
jgi:hypothetical protein